MNLSNRRKAIYITISILLAFFIWFYVNNDEQVVLSIDEIPVEFLNEETSLADKGLMLLKGDDTTVNLELSMPRYLTYRFDTSSVRLVADLSSVTSAGTQSLAYTIAYPPRVSSSDVSVKTPSVRSRSRSASCTARRLRSAASLWAMLPTDTWPELYRSFRKCWRFAASRRILCR